MSTIPTPGPTQNPRSCRTQNLLNYFDATDQRVRTFPYTLDAQMMNLAAVALEDLSMRYSREIDARFSGTCPTLLDNQGVYYGTSLPNTYTLPVAPALPNVQVFKNGAWIQLPPYDDRLPVPARVSIDTSRSITPITTTKVFDLTSDGTYQTSLAPALTLPIPMPLTFWLEGLPGATNVSILISGLAYPFSAWQKNQATTSETVSFTTEGLLASRTVWARIDSITIRNVPQGARLACWHMPFDLPAFPDTQRPFIHSRDQAYARFWKLQPTYLQEVYSAGPLVGLSYIQSYALPEALTGLAVEPRTYGLYAVSNKTLYYVDRREPMPADLAVTAMTTEPMFSVNVSYDETRPGKTRYALLQPLQHASDATLQAWRYIQQDPTGVVTAIDATGAFLTYSGGAGWNSGTPTPISIPMLLNGTYIFSLECMDSTGVLTADEFPYPNLPLNTVTALDISTLMPAASGVAFDSLERLWVWTGTFAIPIVVNYEAYLLDASSRSLYLTDYFSQVQIG